MRLAAPLFLLALLLAAPSSRAPAAAAATPDSASGPGTIRGRIVHQQDPERSLDGITVSLFKGGSLGLSETRAVSGRDGRFSFEGLSVERTTPYILRAEYEGVPYVAGPVFFAPGETEREVEIRVAEVTSEAQPLSVPLVRLRVHRREPGVVRVLESLTLRNGSARTVYVPAEARSARPPAFRTRLPTGAEWLPIPEIQPPGAELRDGEVAFWGPIYPGDQELGFWYQLPAKGERLDFDAACPSGAERTEVWVLAEESAPSGGTLKEIKSKEPESRGFRVFEGPALAPGEHFAFSLDLPEPRVDPDSLGMAEARLLLSLDDAALGVRETQVLEVDSDAGVMAASGEPLLRIDLPEASQNVRFASSTGGLVLEHLSQDEIDVKGVAPPGKSTVAVDYRIPVRGDSVELVRSFEKRVPLLSIYIADTGRLIPESDRLHRREPVRTGDLTYIHLEAFSVAPGERVALRISTRPPSRGAPRGGLMAFVLVAGLLSGSLLLGPLLGRNLGLEEAEAAELPGAREREAIYAAIRDLEHDHETGKIAEADYATMRDELRARAVALLRQEREEAAGAKERSVRPRCVACGSELRATDRFCSHCGAAVAGSRAAEAEE